MESHWNSYYEFLDVKNIYPWDDDAVQWKEQDLAHRSWQDLKQRVAKRRQDQALIKGYRLNTECAICLDMIRDGQQTLHCNNYSCKHRFHADCVQSLAKCPLCRGNKEFIDV